MYVNFPKKKWEKCKIILDVLAMPHKVGAQHVYSGKEAEKATDTLSGPFSIWQVTQATAPATAQIW